MEPIEQPSFSENTSPVRLGFGARMRGYMLTGVLVTAPVLLTVYLGWSFIELMDDWVAPLIPQTYNPQTYLPFHLPGLGLMIAVVVLVILGWVTQGLLGRVFTRISDRIFGRMPIMRGIYGALKQIFETVFAKQSDAFRKVVLLEYPRKGIWVMGFVTGTTKGDIQDKTEGKMINVFVPTTPNPTSGFLLFTTADQLIELDMTVEQGMKMLISAGIVAPGSIEKKS